MSCTSASASTRSTFRLQRGGDGARNLRHLHGVRQARAEVVGVAAGEDLRLVLQAAKGARVDDAIAVALEGIAVGMRRLGIAASARILHANGVSSEHKRSVAKRGRTIRRLVVAQALRRIDLRRPPRRYEVASSEIRISSNGIAQNVTGSVGATPNSSVRIRRVSSKRSGDANRHSADSASTIPLLTTSPQDGDPRSAQRHADADLARALAHQVGQHAVDADRRQRQRDEGEARRAAAWRSAAAPATGQRAAPSSPRCRAADRGRSRESAACTAAASAAGSVLLRSTTFIARVGYCVCGR